MIRFCLLLVSFYSIVSASTVVTPEMYSMTGKNTDEIYPYYQNMSKYRDPSMTYIPGGSFYRYNKDGSKYMCQISPVFIGTYKVTNKEYMECVLDIAANGTIEELEEILPKKLPYEKCIFNLGITDDYLKYYRSNPLYASYPVVGITYNQALKFCQWKTKKALSMMTLTEKNFNVKNNFIVHDNRLSEDSENEESEDGSDNIDSVLRKVKVEKVKEDIEFDSPNIKNTDGVTKKKINKYIKLRPVLDDYEAREKLLQEKKNRLEEKNRLKEKNDRIISSLYDNVFKNILRYRLLTSAEWEFCAACASCEVKDGEVISSQNDHIYDAKTMLAPSMLYNVVTDGQITYKSFDVDSNRISLYADVTKFPIASNGIGGIIGNTFEFVYDGSEQIVCDGCSQFNPIGSGDGSKRIKKGASFRTNIKDVDICKNYEIGADEVDAETGFRIALDLSI